MLLHLSVFLFTGGSLSQHASQVTWLGLSLSRGSLSRGSLSRRVSVRETAPDRDPPPPTECILVMILYLFTETVIITARGLSKPWNFLFERKERILVFTNADWVSGVYIETFFLLSSRGSMGIPRSPSQTICFSFSCSFRQKLCQIIG